MTEKRRCVSCEQEFPLTKRYFAFSKGYFLRRCRICNQIRYELCRTSHARKARLREIQMPAARAWKAAGLSNSFIAADLGVSEDAVRSFFERRAA